MFYINLSLNLCSLFNDFCDDETVGLLYNEKGWGIVTDFDFGIAI